jgi:opacity protein-like surface antigen
MKKLLLAVSLIIASMPVGAETGKGSLQIAAFGGLGFSSSKYDLGITGGEEPVAKGGGTAGGQLVYFFKDQPVLGIGIDGSYTHLSDRDTIDLVRGANATSHLSSTVILAIAKLAYPTGHVRPYVFGGMGTHRTTAFVSAQPFAPFTWNDTPTTENRVLLDETKTSLAVGYGVGLDVFFTDEVFVGMEYRGIFLAHRDFDETAGASSDGLSFERGSLNVQALLFRAGVKFGH